MQSALQLACRRYRCSLWFFFFNDTATTEIYTLSLHDALPIYRGGTGTTGDCGGSRAARQGRSTDLLGELCRDQGRQWQAGADRKSTRLNSSHSQISYVVFCLKKKNTIP